MKVLLLSRYSRLGPSSRLRFLDHAEWLAGQGIEARLAPFFDDSYLQVLYSEGRRPVYPVLRAYARRLRQLLEETDGADLLWIEKELLPWLPYELESLLIRRPFVLDLDDAWFERYAGHANPMVRRFLGRKLARLASRARMVVVGNRYLGEWADSQGARTVSVIPTSVDIARILPAGVRAPGGPFVVGWVGSPSSAPYLGAIAPALQRLSALPDLVVRIVGGGDVALPGVRTEIRDWSEAAEASEIAGIDVGIMPLPDTPWTRGKCGFKILQYFAGARAAVASPVGANRDIIQHGQNGFLVDSTESWVEAIIRLRDDRAMLHRMGEAGRAMVERQYSHSVYRARLAHALQSALG